MNFGYSVGDFIVLGQLAWRIYKACKNAPEEFRNLSQEVLSLHAVLKEVEETYSDATLSTAQRSRLRIVGDGCRGVLEDLQGILDRYNSLGTQTKRTWNQLGWGSKDIAELRSRLISNTVLLTTFMNTSQVVIQKRLDLFLQEFRDGKHEGSIVSTQTVNSLSIDQRQAWRRIRKELEDIGISVAAFDANKDFIMSWFKTAISTGAFEEKPKEDGSDGMLDQDDISLSLENPGHETVRIQPLGDQRHDTNLTFTSMGLQESRLSPEVKTQKQGPPRVFDLVKWLVGHSHDLIKAIKSNNETMVEQLLEKGVDINVKDYSGSSPLHHAVSIRSEVMMRILLQNGADVDAKTRSGVTSLGLAAECGDTKIVQLLLVSGAKIDAKNSNENTALHLAVENGHETVVQFLLENGAEAKEKCLKGFTALHSAAIKGYETVAQLLLENGAEMNEKTVTGFTALHVAAANGHKTVAQLLLENGAEINEKTVTGYTALHLAAFEGHETVAQLLLENGAEINERSRDTYTALGIAMMKKDHSIATILRNAGGLK